MCISAASGHSFRKHPDGITAHPDTLFLDCKGTQQCEAWGCFRASQPFFDTWLLYSSSSSSPLTFSVSFSPLICWSFAGTPQPMVKTKMRARSSSKLNPCFKYFFIINSRILSLELRAVFCLTAPANFLFIFFAARCAIPFNHGAPARVTNFQVLLTHQEK